MIRFLVLGVLAFSCCVTPAVNITKGVTAKGAEPPASVLGAELIVCEDIKAAPEATCCVFGADIAGQDGEASIKCRYYVCQMDLKAEWKLLAGQCMESYEDQPAPKRTKRQLRGQEEL
jgi:hypothetical protein